jgi:quinol monooxygenase YgiN
MIVVSGQLPLRPDARDRAIDAARTMAAASEAEAGCTAYRFAIDVDDPNLLHLFECWESQEAIDTHSASAHMAEFMQLAGEVLGGTPEITRYEVSSSGPLF